MRIKELKRTVNVSWSPGEQYPVLLAAGSAAQQVDSSFSSSSQLELYGLNLEDPGLDLELKASIQTQHKFQKIVWSGAGVIVGGCDGGLLEFYSVEKLLKNTPEALIGSCTKHNGPISALDINPYQKNLLASGASDSEIFIWDINNTGQPMAPGNRSQPPEHVQALAWNQQVQHILGSTFATRCVVWDLRKNEPIMKLSDTQTRTRWRSLAWHPAVATQLCIASEDDQGAVVQLWDLRLAAAPLVTLEGHHKGVLSVSWCKQEPDLLLSAGKDGRVLCWNPNDTRPRGSLLCELSSQPQWVFDVAWCPRSPALFVAAGFDQQVAVHSLLGGSSRPGNSTISNNNIMDSFGASLQQLPAVSAPAPAAAPAPAPAPPAPPAWLRRPAASKFSFGGKLVTFEKCPQEAGAQKLVYVSQVVSEPEVVEQAAELDTLLSLCRDPTATDRLAEYCRQKGEAATDQNERYTWFFLRANFLPTFRSEVLNLLGFKQDEIPSKFKGPSAVSGDYNHIDNNIDSITSGIAGLSRGESTETEAELSTDTSTDLSDAHTLIERKLSAVDAAPAVKNILIPTGEDSTSMICRALICGNLEEAVELCLEAKRVTDALVIASLGSQELLTKVHKYHLNSTSSSPVSLLSGTLLLSRWDALLRAAHADSWRDIAAAVVTHCEGDAGAHYTEALGDKLSSDPDPSLATPATICYLIGMSASSLMARLSSTAGMQGALTELALLIQSAAAARGRQIPPGSKIDSILNEFALRLSSQGCLQSALNMLESAGQSDLRDRLQRALGLQQQRRTSAHPQPQQFGQRTRTASTRQQYQHENTTYNTVQPPSYNNPWAPPAPAPAAPPTVPPAQPSRPASVGPQPGGITSRSKYKVDPSVQAAPQYGQYSFSNPAPTLPPYGYNSPIPDQYSSTTVPNNNFAQNNNYGPAAPNNNNFAPINPYNPNAFTPNSGNPGQGQGNPLGPGNPVNGSYYGEAAPAPVPSKPMQPGWNDPPMMQAKAKPKPDPVAAQAPITHPLFGTEPPQHIPLNPVPGSQQYPGQYPPGQQYPAPNYQHPGQDGYQQYGQQGQGYQQGYGGFPPAAAPAYPQKPESPAPAPAAEAVPKGPIPEEHVVLQTTFDAVRQECASHANNPAMKRKLEDVHRKLENLYDLLREYRLSEAALSTLHTCAQHARAGDSGAALSLATSLAGGADFATVASFLPALKTLLQLRQQVMGR